MQTQGSTTPCTPALTAAGPFQPTLYGATTTDGYRFADGRSSTDRSPVEHADRPQDASQHRIGRQSRSLGANRRGE